MSALKSAWWRPRSYAELRRLSSNQIRRQEKDYVAWLRQHRNCSQKDAKLLIDAQRDVMQEATEPARTDNRTFEERWVSGRVSVRTVRSYSGGKHYEFSPRWPGRESQWHWRRLPNSDAPTLYFVMVDGRRRDSFLVLNRAMAMAKQIAAQHA